VDLPAHGFLNRPLEFVVRPVPACYDPRPVDARTVLPAPPGFRRLPMWIVRLALRRPYTFIVAALVVVILGVVIIRRMPKDIFPDIDIPVVSVIWTYNGMPAEDMEKRIVYYCERFYTSTVNDIEHIESQSINGFGLIKVFFHPGARIEAAVAQISANSQAILRILPPGTTAPFIIRYSASNVPVLQLSVSSETLTESQLFDYGLNFIRTQLFAVQGATIPLPFGGMMRQIRVDLDPDKLSARGVSPRQVSEALNLQNLILPAGTMKMGDREYNVRLNSSPELVEALNNLPVKQAGGATVTIRDVAQVRDGYAVQSNIVREDGKRSTLLTVLKNGGASTLDVVQKLLEALPRVRALVPKELEIRTLSDQSLFVRASLNGVLMEAGLAAFLTGLMILLFLGSWRSTLIVAVAIPLSILCSIIAMRFFGQTLNIMTLGGLALAVGILVDDSTVALENIHRNIGQGKPLIPAILDGSRQIAVPAFVSTLAICIVFAPVVFLEGTAKFLFIPLAMAVVFAMLASYVISRTLLPTLTMYLLPQELDLVRHDQGGAGGALLRGGLFLRIHEAFNDHFEAARERYRAALGWALDRPRFVIGLFTAGILGSFAIYPLIGQEFFPQVDAGQFRLHVRAPTGTRLESTEQLFQEVEDVIRDVIPPSDRVSILDNIGVPGGGSNLAFADTATTGPGDGEILVSLAEERRRSTWDYVRELRKILPAKFPGVSFFLQPSDIVSQTLNFGLPAPIDIQVKGYSPRNFEVSKEIERRVALVPGAVDVHLHQQVDAPELRVDVDRTKALELGLTQSDVASDLLIGLSGSGQTAPNYWLDLKTGVNYSIIVSTPQYALTSVDELLRTPLVGRGGGAPQLLGNVSTSRQARGKLVVNHYNVQPTYDIYAGVQGRDLAGVARDIDGILALFKPEPEEKTPPPGGRKPDAREEPGAPATGDGALELPKGTALTLRGQVESMPSSFVGLAGGLVFAILLVYLLMVVNFQSWTDPFVIAMALPGALAGILWMLFVTQTCINVPSLMGAIMGMGVAAANSILVVTFANDRRREGADARTAALDAGFTRLRPVLMTALAMIIGMLPMSLGLGEGGEQNAPLGRAVIGGLVLATVSTLFFVPVIYSILRRKALPPQEVIPE
jgi:multidrug efflux pump subunit AcrB